MASGIFSISSFKNKIRIVRPNLFVAEFVGINSDAYEQYSNLDLGDSTKSLPTGADAFDSDSFKFRCEQAEFPGRTLSTMDDTSFGGPQSKMAYDTTYNDITITVICDKDMRERTFFERWMDDIVSTPRFTDNGNITFGESGLVGYPMNYQNGKILKISQLDESGKTLYSYSCIHCYPIAITPMTANWEENNTYQRFQATLTYRYYIYQGPEL